MRAPAGSQRPPPARAAAFSTTPEERTPLFFTQPRPQFPRNTSAGPGLMEQIRTQVDAAGEVASSMMELARSVHHLQMEWTAMYKYMLGLLM